MSGSSAAVLATTVGSSDSDGQGRRVHAATTYRADFYRDGMKHHGGLTEVSPVFRLRETLGPPSDSDLATPLLTRLFGIQRAASGLTIQHVGVGLNA